MEIKIKGSSTEIEENKKTLETYKSLPKYNGVKL